MKLEGWSAQRPRLEHPVPKRRSQSLGSCLQLCTRPPLTSLALSPFTRQARFDDSCTFVFPCSLPADLSPLLLISCRPGCSLPRSFFSNNNFNSNHSDASSPRQHLQLYSINNMSFRYQDESPRGSLMFDRQHLRRRSSLQASTVTVASPRSLGSPFVSHLVYDEKTGEIQLPPSPPLPVWKEKSGLDGKPRLPPYRPPKGRAFQLPRPWLSLIAVAAVTVSAITLLSYLVPPS